MEAAQIDILAALQTALDGVENAILVAAAVFVRITAILFMLPGFGERQIPARIKLVGALAFAVAAWPMVTPLVAEAGAALRPSVGSVGLALVAEATIGLLLGFATRLLIFALQTAGMIAAQNMSLSQLFGGVSAEPEPTIATLLSMGAIALALTLGLHVKATALIVSSYEALPLGVFPLSGDVAEWATARVGSAFSLAVSLALPFIVASFIYNVALGFINRAMPQMMVAFVGMPAIILFGLFLLSTTIGGVLYYWHDLFDAVLADPLNVDP